MTAPCPACEGRGPSYALVRYPSGVRLIDATAACQLCRGVKTVSLQTAHWYADGRAHYFARVARGEGFRACALRLGIGLAELSNMEHGRADPARLETDVP